MKNQVQIIQIIIGAFVMGPVLFTGVAIFLGMQTPAAENPDLSTILTLTIANMATFALLFPGSTMIANFVSQSQPENNRVQNWYLIKTAAQEGSALFGVTVFFIAAAGGLIPHASYVWTNLIPVMVFIAATIITFPNEDRVAEKTKELSR